MLWGLKKYEHNPYGKRNETIHKIDNIALVIKPLLLSISHWILATKYLEVCLSFRILMGLVPQEKVPDSKRQIKRIFFWADVAFYTYNLTLTVVKYFYMESRPPLIFSLYLVCFYTSIFILIYSVVSLLRQVKKLRSQYVTNRECLMAVHTIIFGFFVLNETIIAVLRFSGTFEGDKEYRDDCRLKHAFEVIDVVNQFTNDAFVILFVYMVYKQLQ